MKGWKLTAPKTLTEETITEHNVLDASTKIKIIKSLVTLPDVLKYSGEIDCKNVVLGSYGIGVVSETTANLFSLEKGKHVYIEPSRPCGICYNCNNKNELKCSELQVAGEDFDGFLRDFTDVDAKMAYALPDHVADTEALFIGHISLAIAVVDKLNIQKGDYVAIVGANNFGNILAQLLIYYQAVPIIMTNDVENYEIAKNSGIYYALGPNDNWQKEVSSITGGRLAKSVVYISDCNIPINKAFSVASFNASLAFTGIPYKNSSIGFAQAVKKQIDIHCINHGLGNTETSINLIANKAFNFSYLKMNTSSYADVPQMFEELKDSLDKNDKIYETIVELM